MTRKEMVQENNPECIDDETAGGVERCPENYTYLNPTGGKIDCEVTCEACWNKEIIWRTTNDPNRNK